MRGKQMSNKVRDAVSMFLGDTKEPVFNSMTSEKIHQMRGLNYYASHSDVASSKKWALEWIKKNQPEILNASKNKKDWMFSNRGFICRMISRGFQATNQDVENLKKFFVSLSMKEDEVVAEKKKVVKKAEFNVALEEFDYALDRVLMGEDVGVLNFGTSAKQLKEVEARVKQMSSDIEEVPEAYGKETFSKLKKFVKQVSEKIGTLQGATKRQTVSAAKPKTVNPGKISTNVKFKKSDEALGMVGMNPSSVVGAKQMVVFDTNYRHLIVFKAIGDGFMFSGTTLKNFDPETSVFKKIRKPEETIASLKGQVINQMKDIFKSVGSKEFKAGGRFNENMLILKISG